MRTTRALAYLAFLFFVSSSCAKIPHIAVPMVPQDPPGFSILQGESSETEVTLNILYSGPTRPSVILRPLSAGDGSRTKEETDFGIQPAKVEENNRNFSRFRTLVLNYHELSPKLTYELLVESANGQHQDRRTLRTLQTVKKDFRIAVVSCANDSIPIADQNEIWQTLVAKSPDVLFAIGDNVYADSHNGTAIGLVDPVKLWERYVDTRQSLPIYRIPHLIPTLATWDDHDYGANDGDDTYPYREDSVSTFRAFWAQPGWVNGLEAGPSVASSWRAFGQNFIFLDARYGRTADRLPSICQRKPEHIFCKPKSRPPVSPDKETQLGWGQESWLAKHLRESKELIWLIKGDQFFGAYHPFESLEGSHPNAFKNFMSLLRKQKARVLFVSGDRHLSEIMRISPKEFGFATYEITSSPIHSQVYPPRWDEFPNKRQIANLSERYNFVLLDGQVVKNNLRLRVQAIDQKGAIGFDKNFVLPSRQAH